MSSRQRALLARYDGESSAGGPSERERFRRLLYRLRWHQRLTGPEIAELAGAPLGTTEYWFRAFQVRRRDPAPEAEAV